MQDLKDLKDDIIKTFKSEIKAITNKLQSLEHKIQTFEASITSIKSEQKIHATEIQNLKEKMESISSDTKHIHSDEIIGEIEERIRRKRNVIIVGVNELESGTVPERQLHDRMQVKNILEDMNLSGLQTAEIIRIGRLQSGRGRLLRVTLEDEPSKTQMLRNAKFLRSSSRFKNVYVNPDRTPKEQMTFKANLQELQERRRRGEDAVLYRGRVTASDSIKTFRIGF